MSVSWRFLSLSFFGIVASVVLAFVVLVPPVYAEELPGAIHYVQYGSRGISEGDEVYRKEIVPNNNNPSGFWRFSFNWPQAVSNTQSIFLIFHGTFGNLEGNIPQRNVNYGKTSQSWIAGENFIGKSLAFPKLELKEVPSGEYTIMIATLGGSNEVALAEWFASGGVSGIPPGQYSTLTFNYKKYHECCSSLIFIPGIKGSILKVGSDTIWPPSLLSSVFSSDIEKLAIDAVSGESIAPVIEVGLLNNFHGVPIYEGFSNFANNLVASQTIDDWEAFSYDWRFGPEKVIEDKQMISRLENLALNSDTGKVAIVAHSMGGLVGKKLIKDLELQSKSDLVDSFTMVSSPQLGTPQAIASLLHGDQESIFGFLLVEATKVRKVAQNMQSTYNLLPSAKYFDTVADPIIIFNDGSAFTEEWRNYWGPAINTYLDFFSFVTGGGVARLDPPEETLRIPEIIRPDLAEDAFELHEDLDTYIFPENIHVIQVAGWGIPTTKSIEYRNRHLRQGYDIIPTIEGDNAVVYPSSLASNIQDSYFFDLSSFNALESEEDFQHRDIVGAPPVTELIKSVIQGLNIEENKYILQSKPNPGPEEDKLLVSAHSPVLLGVYDEFGRFSGTRNFNENDSMVQIFEEIPNSSFFVNNESQYIFLPKIGSYTFVYEGTGVGSTTIEISTFTNDQKTLLQSYTDIDTSTSTRATFSLINDDVSKDILIEIDENNDGEVDVLIVPDRTELTFDELIALLKEKISALSIDVGTKNSLLNHVIQLETFVRNGSEKTDKRVTSFAKFVEKKGDKDRVDNEDVQEIFDLLEQIESQL